MGDYDYDGGKRLVDRSESLYGAIWTLQKEYNIPINVSVRDLADLLTN